MANAEHLAKLREGPAAWNAWREKNPGIAPDLTRADLALSQRQFGPSKGGPINLSAANLEGAMLRFATLTGANLEGACLAGADLMHARLDRARLIRADLTDAMLDHSDLTGANFEGAVLIGASLQNARNLVQLQVQQAYGDASTLLPAALVPPQEWFPAIEDADEFHGYPVPEQADDDDAYLALGLTSAASPEEVRAAYRGLVKKLHPDLNPGDPAAELRFRKINDAYHMLRLLEDEAELDRQRTRQRQRWALAASFGVFVLLGAGAFYWLSQPVPDVAPGHMAAVRDDIARSAAAGSGLDQGASQQPPIGASTHSPAVKVDPRPKPQPAKDSAASPPPREAAEILNTTAISNDGKTNAEAEKPASASQVAVATPAAEDVRSGQTAARTSDSAETPEPPASGVSADERVDEEAPAIAAARPDKASKTDDGQTPAAEQQALAGAGWEEEWRGLRNSNDLLALHGFIVRHPGRPATEEARGRLRSLIAVLDDAAQLANFLNGADGRSDPETALARERLTKLIVGDALKAEQSLWNAALKKGTKEGFEVYLRAYPKGPHARQANEKIEAQRDGYRKRDEEAWAKARKDGTRAAYAAYLSTNPRGYFVKEAQKKLAEPSPKPKPANPPMFQLFPAD